MDTQHQDRNKTLLKEIVEFVGGMGIGIGILAGIFFLIHPHPTQPSGNSVKNTIVTQQGTVPVATTKLAPNAPRAPQSSAKKVEVETCLLKRETSTLVDKLNIFSNGMSGTFRGVATKVSYTNTNQLAVLELTSLDKTQVTTFDVQAANAKLVGLTKTPIEFSKGLHVGSPIIIGFKCSPKLGNQFVITFIETAAN